MQQLESRHKSELANHFRAQEKELEQLRITYERELDRLCSRHKAELEQRVRPPHLIACILHIHIYNKDCVCLIK